MLKSIWVLPPKRWIGSTEYSFFTMKMLFLAAISALFSAFPQVLTAQEKTTHYSNSKLGISFLYTEKFISVPVPSPQVLVLLHSKEDEYPTFNLIFQLGDPQIDEKSVATLKQEVLGSYRAVGLFDASLNASTKKSIAGRDAFYTEVQYSIKETSFTAAVSMVPAQDRNLIFTFVDMAGGFAEHKKDLAALLNSITLTGPKMPIKKEDTRFDPLLAWGVLGMLLLLALYVVRRIAIKNHRNG